MKISKSQLIQIIQEELAQVMEEDYPELDTSEGSEYEIASAKRREEIGGGLFGDWRQARFDAAKKARETGSGFGKLVKSIATAGD